MIAWEEKWWLWCDEPVSFCSVYPWSNNDNVFVSSWLWECLTVCSGEEVQASMLWFQAGVSWQ